jgi:hypothetical protein
MIKLQKTGKGNNMEINKTVSLIASLAIASSVFTGCATTTLQTKAKMTRTIILDHSKNEDKTIYLQVTNTSGSGGEDMELYSSLKTKLQQKGYTVLNSSKNAGYGLFVNVLFANNLKIYSDKPLECSKTLPKIKPNIIIPTRINIPVLFNISNILTPYLI